MGRHEDTPVLSHRPLGRPVGASGTLLAGQGGGGRPGASAGRDILDAYFYLLRGGVLLADAAPRLPGAGRPSTPRSAAGSSTASGRPGTTRLRDEARLAPAGRPTQPSALALDSQSVKAADHPGDPGVDAGEKNQRPQAARAGGRAGVAAGRAGHPRRASRTVTGPRTCCWPGQGPLPAAAGDLGRRRVRRGS